MNPFVLPWSVVVLPLLVLLILLLREVLITLRIPRYHPEHKMAIFNCLVLSGFFIGGVYGVHLLVLRDADFTARVPRYPSSRYAPERELVDGTGNRIYITNDDVRQVVGYYSGAASSSGYSVIRDSNAYVNGKLVISKLGSTIFLTAVREGDATILYYSESGQIKKVDQ